MGKINKIIDSILSKTFQDTLVPGLEITKEVTLRKKAHGAYNVTTGTLSVTDTDFTVNAAIRQLTLKEIGTINANRQSLVEQGDIMITIGLIDQTTPLLMTIKDIVLIDSTEYAVIDSTTRQLNDKDLVWSIIARRR